MHGQRRTDYKARQRDPKVAAALQQKADHWRQLTAKLGQAPPAALAWELTETLLRVNPDPLYIWNQRRSLICSSFDQETGHDGDAAATRTTTTISYSLEKELSLTAAALQSNPKAYGAWFHRKWILCRQQSHEPTTEMTRKILQQELGLTEMFLQRDERNFHCWNYRRFIVSLILACNNTTTGNAGGGDGSWKLLSSSLTDDKDPKIVMGAQVARGAMAKAKTEDTSFSCNNIDDADNAIAMSTTVKDILTQEWEFTLTKIRQNFSNFSAFHYRSKLLPLLVNGSLSTVAVNLADELQLVEDAVYTEPDDQTAWWYQAFLLDFASKFPTDNASSLTDERIAQHLDALGELAEEVTQCKWVRLGMLACLDRMHNNQRDRKMALWDELITMDPDRATRYKHMRAKLEVES